MENAEFALFNSLKKCKNQVSNMGLSWGKMVEDDIRRELHRDCQRRTSDSAPDHPGSENVIYLKHALDVPAFTPENHSLALLLSILKKRLRRGYRDLPRPNCDEPSQSD